MRVFIKALVLFVIANAAFALANPLPWLGRVSGYSTLWPGRARLPYADSPDKAYSLTLDNLDAMFASHEISSAKAAHEFRVALIGDSSTWGWLLHNEDTLAGQLNTRNLKSADGRRMRFYNLGYPIMSLAKDALILNRALEHQPDLVIWLTTLESFPYDKQYTHPLLLANLEEVARLHLADGVPNFPARCAPGLFSSSCGNTMWSDSIVARRRDLADVARLQLYGPMWAATGIDQDYPVDYEKAARDFEPDESFHNLRPGTLAAQDLAFGVLDAGVRLARERNVPVMIVNEPILISTGMHSDLRYNFFYPRWAYDQYRAQLRSHASDIGLRFVDAWNVVSADEFTNSAVHATPAGVLMLTDRLAEALQ